MTVGPHLETFRTVDHYVNFFKGPHVANRIWFGVLLVLRSFLSVVPAVAFRQMWLQHDDVTEHYENVRQQKIQDSVDLSRWTNILDTNVLDLTPIDFFVWGSIKNSVYETHLVSDTEFVVRTSAGAVNIRKMPDIFHNVKLSMQRRCQACIAAIDRNFKLLL